MRGILEPDHLILILLVVLVLFGGKKIPELASGLGKGIREFKSGMSGNDATPPAPPPQVTRTVTAEPVTPGTPVTETTVIAPEPKRLIS